MSTKISRANFLSKIIDTYFFISKKKFFLQDIAQPDYYLFPSLQNSLNGKLLMMMKLWYRTWFSFFPIKTRSSMSVESWGYQKDGKRSLNIMENISLIKVNSLYLNKMCLIRMKKSAITSGTTQYYD